MTDSLQSLIATGTKLWLDSIDPGLVADNRARGATGATSNPIIVADLIKSGRFDAELARFGSDLDSDAVAWEMTDQLVRQAQDAFLDVWQRTKGDGYVSFELDPLLEDPTQGPSHDERVASYIALGKKWASGHDNRMIKIPATPAGLDAIEGLVAAGVTLNVTLIFTSRQYQAARNAVWRGAQRLDSLDRFKSVFSIFVSRIDVYTEKHVPTLSDAAQGQVGIVNAKRIWRENRDFWADKGTPLNQEIIFASTGTKKPEDPPWKYVAAFAGSDIQTNPPATNQAVLDSGRSFGPQIEEMPSADVLADIDAKVDFVELERILMEEGIKKFADPQKALIALIEEKRGVAAA